MNNMEVRARLITHDKWKKTEYLPELRPYIELAFWSANSFSCVETDITFTRRQFRLIKHRTRTTKKGKQYIEAIYKET